MAEKNTSTLVGAIKKNDRGDHIAVSRSTYGGSDGIDIRNYYTKEDGEIAPTQKGVKINTELVRDVMALILKAMTPEEFMDFEDVYEDIKKSREQEEGE